MEHVFLSLTSLSSLSTYDPSAVVPVVAEQFPAPSRKIYKVGLEKDLFWPVRILGALSLGRPELGLADCDRREFATLPL